jgi:hypothetical protein
MPKTTMLTAVLGVVLVVCPSTSWAGVNLQIDQDSNLELGFEQFRAAEKIGGTADKDFETFLIGFYASY